MLGWNASPFIPTASNAPRPGSITTDIGVPVYQPSVLLLNSWSAAGSTPASNRMSRSGTPMKFAVETRSPPTGLDTHVIVIGRSTSGRPIRSAKLSVNSRATIPCTRSCQSAAASVGIRSAVSIR